MSLTLNGQIKIMVRFIFRIVVEIFTEKELETYYARFSTHFSCQLESIREDRASYFLDFRSALAFYISVWIKIWMSLHTCLILDLEGDEFAAWRFYNLHCNYADSGSEKWELLCRWLPSISIIYNFELELAPCNWWHIFCLTIGNKMG